ncbi:hypothetical protein ST201phi2-1p192 [Pseudomonas phage 201phi2-1]|uniref:Uncharacterized protein n=1 Tax=Pseudomonas phage 201phi2-1 TaxID=198110 RepID=B3FJ55_BP201|nr:hypothetical protein ST201phi2-1p192 [Pseudomonas phage 201phi2-1]ABY63022.1 hypothetical protein 201phi2-1p192 [Pseudomonas phage 201phi2-1]
MNTPASTCSIGVVTQEVYSDFDMTRVLRELKEAMRKGNQSRTFHRNDDPASDKAGELHPMQAARLAYNGWTVERSFSAYTVSGWAIRDKEE